MVPLSLAPTSVAIELVDATASMSRASSSVPSARLPSVFWLVAMTPSVTVELVEATASMSRFWVTRLPSVSVPVVS